MTRSQRSSGKAFKAAREHLNLSRKELGEIIGRSLSTLSAWEAGKTKIPKWAWMYLDSLPDSYAIRV